MTGRRNDETIISCFESTKELVLEQIKSKIFSCGVTEVGDFCRSKSMEEDDSPPIKWWYVG